MDYQLQTQHIHQPLLDIHRPPKSLHSAEQQKKAEQLYSTHWALGLYDHYKLTVFGQLPHPF
jgi:hypothetical protein